MDDHPPDVADSRLSSLRSLLLQLQLPRLYEMVVTAEIEALHEVDAVAQATHRPACSCWLIVAAASAALLQMTSASDQTVQLQWMTQGQVQRRCRFVDGGCSESFAELRQLLVARRFHSPSPQRRASLMLRKSSSSAAAVWLRLRRPAVAAPASR